MSNPLYLPFDPHNLDPADLTTGIRSIELTRAAGGTISIDPAGSQLDIQRERPPVERMEGDLGAICEVFRQSAAWYLTISGITLATGDRLTLTYHRQFYTVSIRVVELENRRARIDPPEIAA